MKKWLVSLACLTIGMLVLAGNAWAISITETANADTLANLLTPLGGGVTISNASFIGGTGLPATNNLFSAGTFTGGGAGIGSGIILTSGNVLNEVGHNTVQFATGRIDTGSDPDLASLIPGFEIFDKTILEFDLTTNTGNIFFDYVFASEEYNEFVNAGFNDRFGFFLSGPGLPTTQNLALIPGTSDAVSIDNVNLGKNAGFFNNNDAGTSQTEYDGFTAVFTASKTGLSAGETYHLKLGIADAGDFKLDSAVFIKGGSFSGTPGGGGPPPPSVPEPTTLTLLGAGMIGLAAVRRRQMA